MGVQYSLKTCLCNFTMSVPKVKVLHPDAPSNPLPQGRMKSPLSLSVIDFLVSTGLIVMVMVQPEFTLRKSRELRFINRGGLFV